MGQTRQKRSYLDDLIHFTSIEQFINTMLLLSCAFNKMLIRESSNRLSHLFTAQKVFCILHKDFQCIPNPDIDSNLLNEALLATSIICLSTFQTHDFLRPQVSIANQFQTSDTIMPVSSEQAITLRDFERPLGGGFQPCFALQLCEKFSDNIKTTTENGNQREDPLEVFEGRYDFSLNLENDYPPYNRRRLHVRVMPKAPQSPDLIPLYHEDLPHSLALIFQSDDTSEKEETRQWNAIHDSTLSLGEHTLRLGEIKIMIIGVIHLDFVDQMGLDDDESCLTRTIDVNLEFWIRIVRPKI